MVTKITNITIMDNGNVSPNSVIRLGNKYENVKDALIFKVPWDNPYKYSCYLSFKLISKTKVNKNQTILLPVNVINTADGQRNLTFFVTSTVTKNSGTYEMVFVASTNANLNSLEEAKKEEIIFVSNVFKGVVDDNFLAKEMEINGIDDNIKILHGDMLELYYGLKENYDTNYYKGDYYYPYIDPLTYELSWKLVRGQNESELPPSINVRGEQGPQGPYYIPTEALDEDGNLVWSKSQEEMDEPKPLNMYPAIEKASNKYLDENLKNTVDNSVDEKFKFTWNPNTQILYIETEELETIPEDAEENGVKF